MIEDSEKLTIWKDRFSTVEGKIASVTFPVYTSKNGSNFTLYGSSVGINVEGNKYICTAKHLLNNVLKSEEKCVIAANRRFEEVNLESAVLIDSESVDIDLCLVKLKNECDDFDFLDQSNFVYSESLHEGSWQYLQGYPLTKNVPALMYPSLVNLARKTTSAPFTTSNISGDSIIK